MLSFQFSHQLQTGALTQYQQYLAHKEYKGTTAQILSEIFLERGRDIDQLNRLAQEPLGKANSKMAREMY
jgi:hypothetical protein